MESTYMKAPSNKNRSVFEEKNAVTSKCDFGNACISFEESFIFNSFEKFLI